MIRWDGFPEGSAARGCDPQHSNRTARKPLSEGAESRTERDGVAVLDDQRLDAVIEAHLYCRLRHILHHVGACGVGAAGSVHAHRLGQRTQPSANPTRSLAVLPQRLARQHVLAVVRSVWCEPAGVCLQQAAPLLGGTVSAEVRLPGALGCHRRHALRAAPSSPLAC